MATLADVLKGNHDLYQKLVGAGFEMNKLAIDVLPGITTELQEKMQLTISQQARLNTLKQRLSAPPPPQDDMLGFAPLLRALTEALRWLPCWLQAVVITDDSTDSVQSATACVSSEPVSGVDQTNAGSILRRRGPVTRS
mmetsp:Transcript_1665/g.3726  ORF Transcript_1665/g.3726 Transcript_1665/m.3726 type:complete len:139 (-) Transcript_1665:962-1378(-)